jgi:hypothetical protein
VQFRSGRQQILCGVAGCVAELVWKERETALSAIEDFLFDPDVMSATDWQATGCEPDDPSAELIDCAFEVAELFEPVKGPFWRQLLDEARLLIVTSRFP